MSVDHLVSAATREGIENSGLMELCYQHSTALVTGGHAGLAGCSRNATEEICHGTFGSDPGLQLRHCEPYRPSF